MKNKHSKKILSQYLQTHPLWATFSLLWRGDKCSALTPHPGETKGRPLRGTEGWGEPLSTQPQGHWGLNGAAGPGQGLLLLSHSAQARGQREAGTGPLLPKPSFPALSMAHCPGGRGGAGRGRRPHSLQNSLLPYCQRPPEITSNCPQSDLRHTNPSVARALPNPRSVERKTSGTCACSLAENCPSVCYADGHIVHTWRHSPGSLEGQGQGGTTGVPGPFGYQGHPGPGLSRGC